MLSGLAMTTAGSSRPCSGADHEILHAIDHLFPGTARHGELVFSDDGRPVVRYGSATAIDSSGRSWPLESSYDGERIRLRPDGGEDEVGRAATEPRRQPFPRHVQHTPRRPVRRQNFEGRKGGRPAD